MVLGHAEDTISKMTELKTLGISFAIDDFGQLLLPEATSNGCPRMNSTARFIQDIPRMGQHGHRRGGDRHGTPHGGST